MNPFAKLNRRFDIVKTCRCGKKFLSLHRLGEHSEMRCAIGPRRRE